MQHQSPARTSRRPLALIATGAILVAGVAGCSGKSSADSTPGAGGGNANAAQQKATQAVSVPAASVNVSASLTSGRLLPTAPVNVAVSGGTLDSVKVTTPAGGEAPGTVSGSTWTPSAPLALNTVYTVTATAKNAAGTAATAVKKFTTINPDNTTDIQQITPAKGDHVGNAMPIVVTFPHAVKNKAAVLKALKVTDTAHAVGAWRWLGDDRVDYRTKTYWPLGDKVTVTAALNGVEVNKGVWGNATTTHTFVVDSDLQAVVSEASHNMVVTKGGKVIKTLPAGTGMPGFRTWTGAMVVMEKDGRVRMTSCSVGLGCDKGSSTYYDLDVDSAVRLTTSGTFTHAAPWDGSIGYANSSHGCVHLTSGDAAWFEDVVEPGDLVTVKGQGDRVSVDNGYGDWNLTWAQWSAPQKLS